ncbi:tRNA cyclic N6-threonylcarbamoyladenosine(37) synthase TcdA [Dongshaea marina]|uniref:tRNA cyclic N6-threonylcarbamoyladenosine(37) synthase TcdA n=1 Tax=Dongshaea marina TaxID=2047966 RepID=UPI000D3EADA9|nr:tRNA cyclic N6-threonylcarbamoyladenosine(37) synthase TcdA [Dongshaea marina]
MDTDYQHRFGGIARLYGTRAVEAFANSHVCVIGIGGVGSWAAEALARSGIGAITLIDMDDICTTNINRQIHALQPSIGKPKCEVMAERIRQINPACKVEVIDDFLSKENLAQYIVTGFDYVIDAIDSVQVKAALLAYCKRNKIRAITIGGAGGQMDPTQIQRGDLARSYQDPLLAKVRSDLRRHYNFTKNPKRKFSIDCVFSTEQLTYPDGSGGVCLQKSMSDGTMKMDCASGFGSATVVTASFAFVAVSRVLERIRERAEQRN